MANQIILAQKYVPILDGIYKRESLTARLLGANSLIYMMNLLGGGAIEQMSIFSLGVSFRTT